MQTRLKLLLQQRHWQTHRTFCAEYDRAASGIAKSLVGTYPSKAQFHRWLAGELVTAPYPDACRVLETMFPGWTAAELVHPVESVDDLSRPADTTGDAEAELLRSVAKRLESPASPTVEWRPVELAVNAPAPRPSGERTDSDADAAEEIARRLMTLSRVRRFSQDETAQLAGLAGTLVDLSMTIDIDVKADGQAHVSYTHEILNLTDRPLTRISRDLWFEHTDGKLRIRAVQVDGHRTAIQRIHDTPNSAQFAIQFSPPVLPGETATATWTCDGVQFIDNHYWRQSLPRHARHLTIRVRHHDGDALASCSAVEAYTDGRENSIQDSLMWDHEDDDVVITLTHDYIQPGQSVTLRWEVTNEPAPR